MFMSMRASKLALADAAVIMSRSKVDARAYLRSIQRRAKSPIPYAVIVEAMHSCDWMDREAVTQYSLALMESR